MSAAGADMADALRLYSAIAAVEPDNTERLVFCVIPGAPVSKSRVRFGRGNAYNRPEAVAAELRTGMFIKAALDGQPYPGNVALGCIFYRPNFQRIDADNLLKHICDSANGVAWKDDCQVTAIFGRVELDKENPRTVVVIGPHQSTLLRGMNDNKPCATCGASVKFDSRRDRAGRRFCSKECSAAGRAVDLSKEISCLQCGTHFRRKTTAQKLCSPECRADRLRSAHRSRALQRSSCTTCGKQLAHARGGRCRDCWRSNPTGRVA